MKTRFASNILIIIISISLLYHFAVLTGIINFENTWGGKLTSIEEMYIFEAISICTNLFLLFIILQKVKFIKQITSDKFINISLWIFVFIFGINTIGNLFANGIIEKILGTIFTIINAFLCWKIVKEK